MGTSPSNMCIDSKDTKCFVFYLKKQMYLLNYSEVENQKQRKDKITIICQSPLFSKLSKIIYLSQAQA